MEETVKLYKTPTCFRCKGLKAILEEYQIPYEEITDIDEMDKKGIRHVPILETSEGLLDYDAACRWAKENRKEAR